MPRRPIQSFLLLVPAVAVFLGACTSGSRSISRAPSTLADSIVLEPIADVAAPVAFAVRPGDGPTVFHIASQTGEVRRVDRASGETSIVASFADLTKAEGERGLLGLAFSPSGDEMYAHYTDLVGDTRVVAVPYSDRRADVSAARVLLAVDQPFANHNGGHLLVDVHGNLLIGLGDGGSGGDPQGNAQDRRSLLGKILRITPNPSSSTTPYSIPPDNPYVGSTTTAPEILFLGLRNPWRFSIDPATGDYWIGDVGQNRFEEIDHVPASAVGANFGWDIREGSRPFEGTTTETLTDPVYEWRNAGGSSSIGGFVYRGSALPQLRGLYIFADLARPGLLVLDPSDGSVSTLDLPVDTVVSLGVDRSGELYVLSMTSGVSALRPRP